jgi:hypothetical protein
MGLVVLRMLKYMCCGCLWCDQSEFMAVLWFLIYGFVQVLFSSLLNFSVGIFLLLFLD